MEKLVTAERERRAIIARSEGEKQSRINRSEGLKAELVNRSEGEMQRQINEAEGKAGEITAIAEATAGSIEKMAEAIDVEGGTAAVELQLSTKYIAQLGTMSQQKTDLILPADLTNLDGLLNSLGLKEEK